jgi:acyl-CoA synthetase (AMP-forming)/AMP-acid ligase II
MPTCVSLFEAFEQAASTPAPVSVIDTEGQQTTITFADMWNKAAQAATWYRTHGVTRAGVVFDTNLDTLVAFLGALRAGITVCSMPGRSRGCDQHSYQTSLVSLAAHHQFDVIVTNGDAEQYPPVATTRIVNATSVRNERRTLTGCDSGQGELWQSTSGSSGNSRQVRLGINQISAQLNAVSEHQQRHDPRNRYLSWFPLHHDFGLHIFFLMPLYKIGVFGYQPGDEIVLLSPRRFATNPLSWLDACVEHDTVITGATGSMLGRSASLLNRRALSGKLAATGVLLGGEMVNPQHLSAFQDACAPYGLGPETIMPGYGMAELVCATNMTEPGQLATKTLNVEALLHGEICDARPEDTSIAVASGGTFLTGVEHRLECASDRFGELLLRGAQLMDGYAGEPDLAPDAWHHTSDLCFIDNNVLYPLGRGDDMLKVDGQYIPAWEIDNIVSSVPGVRETVALTDGNGGYTIVIEADRGQQDTISSAVAQLRRTLLHNVGHAPRRVVFVAAGQLPKTSSGKQQRALTAHMLASGLLTATEHN